MGFWRKLFGRKENEVALEVTLPNPNTNNEYKFYKFVEKTPVYMLEKVLLKIKQENILIKPQYENAINQKIKTGKFNNPHTLESYFGNKFDYIGIDFETANNDRISACALGLAFVKDNVIVDEIFHYICPPVGTKFLQRNIDMHGISSEITQDASTFEELWKFSLKELFNNNLLVLHNASMDASILKNLFDYYQITDYHIVYVCTMKLAKKLDYPCKLIDLCEHWGIEIKHHHDPMCDALACVQIAAELFEHVDCIDEFKDEIVFKSDSLVSKTQTFSSSNIDNRIERKYLFPKKYMDELTKDFFWHKKVVMTGSFERYPIRNELAKIFWEFGADVDTRVSDKTNILVLGQGYGYKKFEQAQANIKNGCNTVIYDEKQLLELLSKFNK